MGYVNCMVLVMYNKWNGQTEQLWDLVQSRSLVAAPSITEVGAGGGEPGAHSSGSPRSPAVAGQTGGQNHSGEATGGNSGAKLYVKRNCTEAMLKVGVVAPVVECRGCMCSTQHWAQVCRTTPSVAVCPRQ